MHASHDGGSARSFVFLWERRLLPGGQALFCRYCDDSIHVQGICFPATIGIRVDFSSVRNTHADNNPSPTSSKSKPPTAIVPS